MKKLRLNIESLRVESFGTGSAAAGGTVVGHFDQAVTLPIDDTIGGDRSRIDSCYFNTCYDTCDWTD
jgi:hypothetical protein